ncbi:MAG: acylphosphatase [Hydrocarboniphaga sp.]|uniref:acylphosphatase n=1 Tax=Hydrocarboniphaga sp. TaxID=2033016 RepID=UPI00260ECAF7|nr:acylphosphatase [Hydrocarboniphaga sp.]MDB5972694.1 acylphosphatase [Hydrocarboniphaga sp.]
MNSAFKLCYRFSVNGRVQGVYFRQSTRHKALELGLRGWVRNCEDGSVEGCAYGEPDALEQLRAWLHLGPAAAQVDQLEWISEDSPGFDDFEVRNS